MESKIKSCYKCGGKGILNIDETELKNGHFIRWSFVRCEKCGETGKTFSDLIFCPTQDKSISSAIKQWNELEKR
jgi:DnaJ-class molecular chaperone